MRRGPSSGSPPSPSITRGASSKAGASPPRTTRRADALLQREVERVEVGLRDRARVRVGDRGERLRGVVARALGAGEVARPVAGPGERLVAGERREVVVR